MTDSGRGPLDGRNVLIVEDRYLIACEMSDHVDRLGGQVLGPSSDVAAAARILAGEKVDLALLDVDLDGEQIFPLAEALTEKGVPFIFLTGYEADVLPAKWRDRPRLAKPVNSRTLNDELARIGVV